MPTLLRHLPFAWFGIVLGVGWVSAAAATPEDATDFLRDIRPILSTHCFKCHGPDAKSRKGGLRLDLRDEAIQPGKSKSRAIDPDQPARSSLLARIDSEDPDEVMPPPSTKNPLTAVEKEKLRKWLMAGAEYRPHWAFVPPKAALVPAVVSQDTAVPPPVNPIDAFVRARLVSAGLQPAPEADRATLIRRVSLDLIGLVPSQEETDAFLADADPRAYERWVDHLLASKHYGERWARRWMDLARYADTNGYEKDRPRSIWPWRDWLIQALNDDLPFDRFTVEQIAGDMLPGATASQRIATGFHRNTMLNEEGGVDPLEFRFHSMVDRVHTTATTWLGMTMSCAQCHSHKYDPIDHREYYQFMALLDNADEPVMDVPDAAKEAKRKEVERRIAEAQSGLLNRFPVPEEVLYVTPPAQRVTTERGEPRPGPTALPDGSYRFSGPAADKDTYTFDFETTLTRVTRLNLDVLADDTLPSKGPGRTAHGNFVLSEIQILAAPAGSPASTPPTPVAIASAIADFSQPGFPIEQAFDQKPDTGWAIAGQGTWNINRRATFRLDGQVGFAEGTRFTIRLVQHYGGQHLIGRVRFGFGVEKPDPRPVETRRQERVEQQFTQWQLRSVDQTRAWVPLRPTSATSSVPVLAVQPDDSVFVSSDQTKSDTYDLAFDSSLKGITAMRLEVLPDERLPRGGPGRVYFEGPLGDFYLSTFAVRAGGKPVRLNRPSQSYASGGNTAAKALDDDQQSGWSIDGGQGRRHVAVFNFETPLDDASDLRVAMLFERYHPAGLGRFRISVTTDPRGAEALLLSDELQLALRKPVADRTETERQALLKAFAAEAPELASERSAIENLRREIPAFPTTLVMQERPADNPRRTRVRTRGEFLQPAEPVTPGLPAFLAATAGSQPTNRLQLAQWLVSRSNPLTARVVMNRHWAAFFGRGLVRTTEDFGFQGELPTHPELLDWLAVEFMNRGWSQKAMHRLIVLSATYRQSSRVLPIHLEKDPQNLLLARSPRIRLEGEIVRDVALSASGLLSPKLGGPSVFPPQLASITREGTYGPLDWNVSQGEDRFRRGIYTFVKRTAPYAAFQTFDAPSGEACVARREVSNTPLQSLTLLNDEVFLEAAQSLGRKAASLAGNDTVAAVYLFRRVLCRLPQPAELREILAFLHVQRERIAHGTLRAEDLAGPGEGSPAERAAWSLVARALLNLDEAVTRI